MTERTTRRWPGLKHVRRPTTRRGWLITIAASGAILALKLTLGLGVLALVVHLLAHGRHPGDRSRGPRGGMFSPGGARAGRGRRANVARQD